VEQNNVLLTALALVSPQNKYDGAGIVLTTGLAVKNGDVPPAGTLSSNGPSTLSLEAALAGIPSFNPFSFPSKSIPHQER
jgi:hypothetical protein